MTLEELKALGFKSFDIQGNGSHHDYTTQPAFREDAAGEYALTKDDLVKAMKRAEKDELEMWEVAYGEQE